MIRSCQAPLFIQFILFAVLATPLFSNENPAFLPNRLSHNLPAAWSMASLPVLSETLVSDWLSNAEVNAVESLFAWDGNGWLAWPLTLAESLGLAPLIHLKPEQGVFVKTSESQPYKFHDAQASRRGVEITSSGWHLVSLHLYETVPAVSLITDAIVSAHPFLSIDRVFAYQDGVWKRLLTARQNEATLQELRPREAFWIYVKEVDGHAVSEANPLRLKPLGKPKHSAITQISLLEVSSQTQICVEMEAPLQSETELELYFQVNPDTDSQNSYFARFGVIGTVSGNASGFTSACFLWDHNQEIAGTGSMQTKLWIVPLRKTSASSEDRIKEDPVLGETTLNQLGKFQALPFQISPKRNQFASIQIAGRLLFHGGAITQGANNLDDALLMGYDPSLQQSYFLRHGPGRKRHSLSYISPNLYILGGTRTTPLGAQNLSTVFEKIELGQDLYQAGATTVLPPMPHGVEYAATWVNDSKIYVLSQLGFIQIFSTVSQTWETQAIDPNDSRKMATAILCQGSVYIAGGTGANSTPARQILRLNPADSSIQSRIAIPDTVSLVSPNAAPAGFCLASGLFLYGGTLPTNHLFKLDLQNEVLAQIPIPQAINPTASQEWASMTFAENTAFVFKRSGQENLSGFIYHEGKPFSQRPQHLTTTPNLSSIQIQGNRILLTGSSFPQIPIKVQTATNANGPWSLLPKENLSGISATPGNGFLTVIDVSGIISEPASPLYLRLDLSSGLLFQNTNQVVANPFLAQMQTIASDQFLPRHNASRLSQNEPMKFFQYGGFNQQNSNQGLRGELAIINPLNRESSNLSLSNLSIAPPGISGAALSLDEAKEWLYVFSDMESPTNPEASLGLRSQGVLVRVNINDFRREVLASSGIGRANPASLIKNGILHVFGGKDSENKLSQSWLRYDIQNQYWLEPVQTQLLPRHGHVAIPYLHKILLFGGEYKSGSASFDLAFASQVEIIDPISGNVDTYEGLNLNSSGFNPTVEHLAYTQVSDHLYCYSQGKLLQLNLSTLQQKMIVNNLVSISNPLLAFSMEKQSFYLAGYHSGASINSTLGGRMFEIPMYSDAPHPVRPISVSANTQSTDVRIRFKNDSQRVNALTQNDLTLSISSGGVSFTTVSNFLVQNLATAGEYELVIKKEDMAFFSPHLVFQLNGPDNTTIMESPVSGHSLNFGTVEPVCREPAFSPPHQSTLNSLEQEIRVSGLGSNASPYLVWGRRMQKLELASGSQDEYLAVVELQNGANSGSIFYSGCSKPLQYTVQADPIVLSAEITNLKNLTFSPLGIASKLPAATVLLNGPLNAEQMRLEIQPVSQNPEAQPCSLSRLQFSSLNANRLFRGSFCKDMTSLGNSCILAPGSYEITLWDGTCSSGSYADAGEWDLKLTFVGQDQIHTGNVIRTKVLY